MSAKTKIVVVKMKHVILTGVLLGILLLLIIFAATYFFSGDESGTALPDAPQSFCRRSTEKGRPAL